MPPTHRRCLRRQIVGVIELLYAESDFFHTSPISLFRPIFPGDDDDESKSYVRPLSQLETVTNVLRASKVSKVKYTVTSICMAHYTLTNVERGCKTAAALRCWKRIPGGRSCHAAVGEGARTV